MTLHQAYDKNLIHKIFMAICIAMCCMLFGLGNRDVYADIASGTSGTCSWVIDDDGMLTISPTDGLHGTLASYTNGNGGPWYSYRSQIKEIRIEPGVKTSTGCYRLFYNLT